MTRPDWLHTFDYILQEIGRLKARLERCEREIAELKAARASRQSCEYQMTRTAIKRNGNVYCFPGITLQGVKRWRQRKGGQP